MSERRRLTRGLLWLHLFVCCVWLYLFHGAVCPPAWTLHVLVWSVLAVQFTWGFTVGLAVGPARRDRHRLWWSLLTVFMPLYFVSALFRGLLFVLGLPLAVVYLALFITILACETFGGVMLGANLHSRLRRP